MPLLNVSIYTTQDSWKFACRRGIWAAPIVAYNPWINDETVGLAGSPYASTSPSLEGNPVALLGIQDDFLAFDPTVSPHFEVFLMHCVRSRCPDDTELGDTASPDSEWPPSSYVMSAFSSKTWRWEDQSFVREGTAVRSVADVLPFLRNVSRHSAVYWRGRLYVYHLYFVLRFSLEDNMYRVIRLPPMNEECGMTEPHLGKSEKGVYYGFVHGRSKLQMWFLDESTDQAEWMLKHETDLTPLQANFPVKHSDGPWFVQDVKHEALAKEKLEWDSDNDDDGIVATATATEVTPWFVQDVKHEALAKEKLEWDSDNDDDGLVATATGTEVITLEKGLHGYISILGFHPYKEVIFLHMSSRVMAYHLSSSKLEDLGCLPLDGDDEIWSSCTYTPCWMENCLRANSFDANIEP